MRAIVLVVKGGINQKEVYRKVHRLNRLTILISGGQQPLAQKRGKLEFRLVRQITTYKKSDPPPTLVQPLPIAVLQALKSYLQEGKERQQAIR